MKTKKTKGEATRHALIEASIKLFHREGLNRVSFSSIGQAIGVSQPALYVYFKDKESLFLACCEHVFESSRHKVDQNSHSKKPTKKDPINRIKAWTLGNLKWAQKYPREANVILSAIHLAGNDKRFREFFLKNNAESHRRVIEVLRPLGENHKWTPEQLNLRSRLVQSLVTGEIIKSLHGAAPPDPLTHFKEIWPEILHLLTHSTK